MLTDREKRAIESELSEAIGRLEARIIEAAGSVILGLDGLDSYSVAKGLSKVSSGTRQAVKDSEGVVFSALSKSVNDLFEENANNELEKVSRGSSAGAVAAASAGVSAVAVADSKVRARKTYNAVSPLIQRMLYNLPETTQSAYVKACQVAAVQVSRVGTDEAMRKAVGYLANRGIAVNIVKRSDGSSYSVPVDVGIRRTVTNAGTRERMAQTMFIAQAAGEDLVEVSTTINPRESHQEWQGQIYSISGDSLDYPKFEDACHVGDEVDGIGGYNCGHEFSIYREELGKTFGDPLEGTGYTPEEASEITSKQRALERGIRASKREAAALDALGLNSSEARASVRDGQAAVRELCEQHPAILTRDYTRERVYA